MTARELRNGMRVQLRDGDQGDVHAVNRDGFRVRFRDGEDKGYSWFVESAFTIISRPPTKETDHDHIAQILTLIDLDRDEVENQLALYREGLAIDLKEIADDPATPDRQRIGLNSAAERLTRAADRVGHHVPRMEVKEDDFAKRQRLQEFQVGLWRGDIFAAKMSYGVYHRVDGLIHGSDVLYSTWHVAEPGWRVTGGKKARFFKDLVLDTNRLTQEDVDYATRVHQEWAKPEETIERDDSPVRNLMADLLSGTGLPRTATDEMADRLLARMRGED